ncbi:MAG: hypothetical protein JWP08_431 [Bryobacterales bacterium]|nr:hypothetical protein [Bryobacterales bacterium]
MIAKIQKTLTAINQRGSQPVTPEPAPVASALGIRLGATPRGRNHANTHSPTPGPKQGHSYLAAKRDIFILP